MSLLGSIRVLITSLALASLALPTVKTAELTPDNFKTSTAKGLWFVEHFSPYCGHCTAFAPTWEKLTRDTETEEPSVRLAQINCVLHGDLCDQNGVKGYPTIVMYEDGEKVDTYKGSRELDDLKKFIKQHVKDEAPKAPVAELAPAVLHKPEPPRQVLNPTGEVLQLNPELFTTTLARGPAFVKFFAPWCGHCKKLAPIWKQLARHMQGKVNVAEVNCDDHAALCKSENIQGYPTLIYFANGAPSEYNGGRKLDQLKAFAEKASADGLKILETDEDLDKHIEEDKVLYLFVHSPADTEIVRIIRDSASALLGSPIIYASSSSHIRSRFSIPVGVPWALLAIKDHDAKLVASALYGSPSITHEGLKSWLLSHRIPGSLELTQDTFQGVMNAPHSPLVVIAAVTKTNKAKIEERVRDVAKKWRVRTDGTGEVRGREVVFTWMDAGRWAEWMKSMYGIKVYDDDDGDDLDDVKVVVADHKNLIYYDEDRSGSSIKITSTGTLFAAIEDAATGKLKSKNSENLVERMARYLNAKMNAVETYVFTHPFRAVFLVLACIAVGFWLISRWIGNDAAALERGDYHKAKAGRLD